MNIKTSKFLPAIIPVLIWLILSAPAFADVIYTVEQGDSAWSIALEFGVSLEELYLANGWASDENPVLQIGQHIAIPSDREEDKTLSESDEEDEPAEEVSSLTYIVQSGDNPYLIAQRFKTGTLCLLEYNDLTEEDLIHPGQVLRIPPEDYEYQGGAEVESGSESEPSAEPMRYTVQPGDNPWVIARRFGVSLQALLALNGLDSSSILHVGDELLVPVDSQGQLASRSMTFTRHTVEAGDTLSEVAYANGISTAAVMEANGLNPASVLRPGQELIIPSYRTVTGDTAGERNVTPPVPEPATDYTGTLNPLPELSTESGDDSDWDNSIFDFSRIVLPEPSSENPEDASDGNLSVDGHFNDGVAYHLYTVRRGDTISGIASSSGVTQSELMERNGIDNRTMLRIGRDIRVPLPGTSGTGSSGPVEFGAPDISIGSGEGTDLGRAIVEEGCGHIGTPYVWSGTSLTGGVDCSGFTMKVYEKFGIDLPHRARDQAGHGIEVSYDDLLPGDLVFFHTTRSGISHVGIYIGNGKFVHSSSHRGGVVISPMDSGYYNRRFVCARRVL